MGMFSVQIILLLLSLTLLAVAQVPSFSCNDFNGDCVGCVQYAENLVSQCSYCPTDGVCHTVGSVFNKCSSEECISVSRASSCEKNYVDACNEIKYGDSGFPAGRKITPSFNETKSIA